MKATIGLDAGHGGSSTGTYSVNTVKDGLFEKVVPVSGAQMRHGRSDVP